MGLLGSTLVYLGLFRSTWVYFGLLGSTWVYLGLLESTLVYLDLLGSTWIYLGLLGSTWIYLGLLGSTWVYWVYLGLLGSTWVYLGLLGYLGTLAPPSALQWPRCSARTPSYFLQSVVDSLTSCLGEIHATCLFDICAPTMQEVQPGYLSKSTFVKCSACRHIGASVLDDVQALFNRKTSCCSQFPYYPLPLEMDETPF